MNKQPHRRARPDRDRGLDVEIAHSDLVTGPADIILGRALKGLNQIAVAGERQLGTDTEQRRQGHPLDQLPGMEVDLVLKAGIAGRIGRRVIVDSDRAAVGQDDPLLDNQRSLLAECHNGVVASDEPGTLGNEIAL